MDNLVQSFLFILLRELIWLPILRVESQPLEADRDRGHVDLLLGRGDWVVGLRWLNWSLWLVHVNGAIRVIEVWVQSPAVGEDRLMDLFRDIVIVSQPFFVVISCFAGWSID